jgi:hypothetical protein
MAPPESASYEHATVTGLRHATVLCALFTVSIAATGRERPPGLDEVEMEHRLHQASRAFEKPDLSIEQISADFEYRCLRAIGDPVFCKCLVSRRPYILRFEQYIGISSKTKDELRYDTLGNNSKTVVDEVYAVRDECVGEN